MSLPRAGSRTVQVGEHRYRWYVRHKPTTAQAAPNRAMTVAIERVAAEPGRVLLVDLGVSRPDNSIEPHQTALSPALVRRIISEALRDGWDPIARGSAFRSRFQLIKHKP